METNKGVGAFHAKTRLQWRKWLQKHSQKKESVYLILYHKKSKTKSVSYVEAVEESLCYGWIDSLKHKRDPESSYQKFSPRRSNSNWSTSNVERVKRMKKEGLMTEHGQKMIDVAKQNGKWQAALVI